MKILGYYIRKDPTKNKLSVSYDKKYQDRPAWIQIKGLPNNVNFIRIHLGKKGKKGRRIQFYKTHLPPGLFLPIDYTFKEMQEYYNKLAQVYDKKIKECGYNIEAGKFLCGKVKKYSNKSVSVLDLGAGTGLITEIYVDSGFGDMTLVDYSKGMLNKAKKRKKLKNCKFIRMDIKGLDLKKKYDVIISHFSVGSPSYFNEEELRKVIRLVKKHLKSGGIVGVLAHFNQKLFEKHFKKLESGIYTLDKKMEFYTDYFIGRK